MEWAQIITSLAGIITPIGIGFGWLIKEIVKSSREAVAELRKENEVVKADRDIWRDRAYQSGWRAEE